jgi:hypothetical protein
MALPVLQSDISPEDAGYDPWEDHVVLMAEVKQENTGWEMAIGQNTQSNISEQLSSHDGGFEAWGTDNPDSRAFSLVRTGNTVVFTVDDDAVAYDGAGPVNDLFVEAKVSGGVDASVAIDRMWFDGEPIPEEFNLSVVNPDATTYDILRVSDFEGDFGLSGTLTFAWDGTQPTNSRQEMIIKGFHREVPVPEPSVVSLLLVGIGALGIGYRRKK